MSSLSLALGIQPFDPSTSVNRSCRACRLATVGSRPPVLLLSAKPSLPQSPPTTPRSIFPHLTLCRPHHTSAAGNVITMAEHGDWKDVLANADIETARLIVQLQLADSFELSRTFDGVPDAVLAEELHREDLKKLLADLTNRQRGEDLEEDENELEEAFEQAVSPTQLKVVIRTPLTSFRHTEEH